VDCTHVKLLNCPKSYCLQSTGKDKYPTRSFEVVCDFFRKIIHTTPGHPGRSNDKIVVSHDLFVQGLRNNLIGTEQVWSYNGSDGELFTEIGNLYLICDGGYPSYEILVTNFKISNEEVIKIWSNMLECVRKCIECCFGILKQRFRILKLGTSIRSFVELDDFWYSCCAFHNMLIDQSDEYESINITENSEASMIENGTEEDPEKNSNSLRAKLINHFSYNWVNKSIEWPTRVASRPKLKSLV